MLTETFSEETLGELDHLFRRRLLRKKCAKRTAATEYGKTPEEEAP